MKVLVIYDSVSPQKLTASVAQTITDALREKGLNVDSFHVKDTDRATIKDCDCLIVGAPTMAFGVSNDMKQFLKGLQREALSGRLGATFDTQIQSRLSGSAAKGIEKRLKELGLRLISEPLVTYVEGKVPDMRLKEGELDKATSWAVDVVNKLSP